MTIIPPYLKKGDVIGVVCPSGSMSLDKMQSCFQTLEDWGFVVKRGKTLGTSFHYFSGTDDERLQDLQTMLDDDEVKAILCARGGYGLSRIIDKISFDKFLLKPKWVVGYSDITILHSHLFQQYNIASLHSPMAGAFNDDGNKNEYVQSLFQALVGFQLSYTCAGSAYNKLGEAEGELVGGNLCLLSHLIGSKSSIDTREKLLFIEDIGEYIYNIDRLMMQLKRSGKLDDLSGLIIGSFTDMKDTTIPFGASVYDVIYDAVKDYAYPLCFGFPVGHATENLALKHGVPHKLTVTANRATLTQKS